MAAENKRFRLFSRSLLAGRLGMCALLALAAIATNRCAAQSTPPQQADATPSQPAAQDATPAPAKPTPDAQPDSKKNADADDDKWPDPEWMTQQKQAAAAAADTAQQTQPPATAAPASNQPPASTQPTPGTQSSPAPAPQDAATTPIAPETEPATAAEPRPPYPGMTPEEKSKQLVAQQCADLLKLATDLKAQVDKSRKDELSVAVVRKAAEVEQTAHKVRTGTAQLSASK